MKIKLILIISLTAGLLFTAVGQNKTNVKQNLETRIQDQSLGISFSKIGSVEKQDSSTYRITHYCPVIS